MPHAGRERGPPAPARSSARRARRAEERIGTSVRRSARNAPPRAVKRREGASFAAELADISAASEFCASTQPGSEQWVRVYSSR